MPRESRPKWRATFGCYIYHHQGVRHYLRGIAKGDAKGAEAAARKVVAGLERAAQLSVQDVCVLHLIALKASGAAERTVRDRKWDLRIFCDFAGAGERYGDRPAAEITATDFARFDRWCEREKKWSPGYRGRFYRSVGACWAWAARPEPDREPERLLPSDPLAGQRRPKRRSRADRMAERGEIAAYLRGIRRLIPDDHPSRRAYRDVLILIRLMAATGCRTGEACVATWEGWTPCGGFDAHGHRYGILRVDHKNRRHKGPTRPIVVPPSIVRAIERIRGREDRHPTALFAHAEGPWNVQALNYRLRRWRGKIPGVRADLTPYCCRHAWFSRVAPTIGAELAALLGGNSAEVVRDTYLHARDADLVAAAVAARKR